MSNDDEDSLRDVFAAAALAGCATAFSSISVIAERAWDISEAMIEERKERKRLIPPKDW